MSDLEFRAENYDHFTLSIGISQSIAGDRDIDKDGVINPDDKCPTIAEDLDQFEDGDGCPDEDNDGDGIKDDEDQCRDDKEDMDGDEDEDGCPDLDKDGDKVLDEVDLCKEQPEDVDGFKDEDGCPDPDNDEDGIEDSKDQCPDEKESVNGFQDEDGCPEKDTDGDGIFDSVDQCDSKKETFNGLKDEDGCPDELSPELSEMIGVREEITFKRKTTKLDKQARVKEQLKPLADQLKMEPLKVRITVASASSEGLNAEEQAAINVERAQLIQRLLAELGVPEEQMTTTPDEDKEPVSPEAQQVKRRKGAFLVVSPWVVEPKYEAPKPEDPAKKGVRKKDEDPAKKGVRKKDTDGKGDPKVRLVP
jgi:outer membrane protein OmpA-like peptidoglycan-associated protein